MEDEQIIPAGNVNIESDDDRSEFDPYIYVPDPTERLGWRQYWVERKKPGDKANRRLGF